MGPQRVSALAEKAQWPSSKKRGDQIAEYRILREGEEKGDQSNRNSEKTQGAVRGGVSMESITAQNWAAYRKFLIGRKARHETGRVRGRSSGPGVQRHIRFRRSRQAGGSKVGEGCEGKGRLWRQDFICLPTRERSRVKGETRKKSKSKNGFNEPKEIIGRTLLIRVYRAEWVSAGARS